MNGGPGTLSGRYQLGEPLGQGGMAVVHSARDLVLDRPVAVKVLRDAVDAADRDRFVSEARLLARLSHPGVVTILDAGITAEQPFLVMELVEGPTLAAELRSRRLAAAEVAGIGSQIAATLAYAHGLGVVHRDVKPSNVILGSDGQVKLADFGIARLIGDTMRHTRTGTVIGTAAYLSPEQVRGQSVGPPSDVYSLGLVLLECLTGEAAYSGSPVEMAMARLHRPPDVPGDLPDGWRALLHAMTALQPAQRPPAHLVHDRLREFSAPAPLPSRPGATPPAPPPTGAGTTLVMPTTPSPATVTAPSRAPSVRAGDWWRGAPVQQRAAAVAVALLFLVLAVVAVVGATSGGEGRDDVPAETPSELRDPLQDLHDAIHGGE